MLYREFFYRLMCCLGLNMIISRVTCIGLLFLAPNLSHAFQLSNRSQNELKKVEEHQQRARIHKLAARKAQKKKHPDLVVKGGSSSLQENIKNSLAFDRLSCHLNSTQRHYYEKKWLESATKASRAMGYYHATWKWQTTDNPEKKCWKANLTVSPGKRTLFGDIDVSVVGAGSDLPAIKNIFQSLPLKKGKPVDHQKYEHLKSLLVGTAQQLGFRDAAFDTKQLSVDLDTYTADVLLVFNTGERYRFGEVSFEQTVLDEEFLRRYITIKTDEPFDYKPLTDLQQTLTDSRYFSLVDIQQLSPEIDQNRIPLLIQLTPARRRTTSFGVGYSSEPEPSPRFSVDYINRRVNRLGHRFNASIQTALKRQTISADYSIPLLNPTIDQLKFSSLWEHEETQVRESSNRSLGAAWVRQLDTGWQQTIDLTLLNETFEFESAGIDDLAEMQGREDLGQLGELGKQTRWFLLPGVSWQKTKSNDLFYPTKGWRASLSLKAASQALLSDTNMSQLRFSAKRIHSLGLSRLHARVDFGTTLVDDFSRVPATLRFFAGGDNSVRGYAFETLGPVSNALVDIINAELSDGDSITDEAFDPVVVGGKHLITASVEWDHPIWKKISGALFFDTGNAFDDNQFTLKQSTGFGLRWRSPVGPIRMDFAFPIDDDEHDFRFHLALGTDL